MAYGVIIYEGEHDILMDMTPEQVGNVVQNMIRAFRGEEHKHLESENAYSLSMYKRVSEDKGKIPDKVIAGSKGGAPEGNKNACKKQGKTTKNNQKQAETSKDNSQTSKTTYNNNYNNNNNNNKTLYKPNQFTNGVVPQEYNFPLLEKKLIKN